MRRSVGIALFGLLAATVATGEPASRLAGELDASGLKQTISRQKGRVVLLNFWATWCVPCREEFPSLSRLQNEHRKSGLTVVGVSTDFQKQLAEVEKFLGQQRPSFANYRKKSGGDDQDFIEAVDSSWGGELPFSVLYDRTGKKVKIYSGKLEIPAVDREIRRLLAASAS
jgi:thiol-disulfide isomerase/thioredoxin